MQHKAQCKASHLLAIVQRDRINESIRLSQNIQWVLKTDPLLHPSPTYQTSSVPHKLASASVALASCSGICHERSNTKRNRSLQHVQVGSTEPLA
jgi:hypothetical protein